MGTKQIKTVDWSDRLLTKNVLYYDLSLDDPGTPRRAAIVGRGPDEGCAHLIVFSHPVLDANRARNRHVNNVFLIRSIDDRVPSLTRVGLLVDDAPVSAPLRAQAEGKHLNELTTAEDRAKTKPKALIDSTGDLPDQDAWEETKPPEIIDEDPEETPEPKPPAPPQTRAAALIAWDPMRPLVEGFRVTEVNSETVHVAAMVDDDWVDIVRIVHIKGEDAMSTGYTMRVVDAAGRMSIDLGSIVPPSKTDAEIKTLIAVAKKLVEAVNRSPDQEEANNRLRTIIAKWRAGKLVVG